MRQIVIIVGSKNDFKQCAAGLNVLATNVANKSIKAVFHVKSIHRHTEKLLELLRTLSAEGQTDVIIAGAGKAAHLPGCIDAYLRNHLKDTKITVLGVAFTNGDDQDDQAAVLSITQVPKTQVIFAGQGSHGFENACLKACETVAFPPIKLTEIPPDQELGLLEAMGLALMN